MRETLELGDLRQLAEGDIFCVAGAGSYGVLICRVDGALFAIEDNCSLCDAPLNGGKLDAHRLICPQHEDWFDIRDGSPNGQPAPAALRTHSIDGPEHALRLHLTNG